MTPQDYYTMGVLSLVGLVIVVILLSKIKPWIKVSLVNIIAHGVIMANLWYVPQAAIAYEYLILIGIFVCSSLITWKALLWVFKIHSSE